MFNILVFNVSFSTFLMDYRVLVESFPMASVKDAAKMVGQGDYRFVLSKTWMSGFEWKALSLDHPDFHQAITTNPPLVLLSERRVFRSIAKNRNHFTFNDLGFIDVELWNAGFTDGFSFLPMNENFRKYTLFLIRKRYSSKCKDRLNIAAAKLLEAAILRQHYGHRLFYTNQTPRSSYRPLVSADITVIMLVWAAGCVISISIQAIEKSLDLNGCIN